MNPASNLLPKAWWKFWCKFALIQNSICRIMLRTLVKSMAMLVSNPSRRLDQKSYWWRWNSHVLDTGQTERSELSFKFQVYWTSAWFSQATPGIPLFFTQPFNRTKSWMIALNYLHKTRLLMRRYCHPVGKFPVHFFSFLTVFPHTFSLLSRQSDLSFIQEIGVQCT